LHLPVVEGVSGDDERSYAPFPESSERLVDLDFIARGQGRKISDCKADLPVRGLAIRVRDFGATKPVSAMVIGVPVQPSILARSDRCDLRLRAYPCNCSVGSVIDLRREGRFKGSSGNQPFDLTRRSSLTTRSYSSRGLLIRYMRSPSRSGIAQ
jgi:hypothetical protein